MLSHGQVVSPENLGRGHVISRIGEGVGTEGIQLGEKGRSYIS